MPWEDELDTDEGWAKYNRHFWLRDYRGFVEFFFGKIFREPHSTKQIEDCVGWGLETSAETLIAAHYGAKPEPEEARELARRVRCPVLVLHGVKTRSRHTRADARSPSTRAATSSCSKAAGMLRTRGIPSSSIFCCATSRGGLRDPRRGRPRADPRPLPGRGGLRRARRRARLLRGLRLAAYRRSCCCRRGRSSTRATGRCRSRSSPGTAVSSRSTGVGTAAPTARRAPRHTTIREFAADALAVHGRDRDGARRPRRRARARRSGASCSPRSIRSASPAPRSSGRPSRLAPPLPERTVYAFGRASSTPTKGWAKYNMHHWLRDYRDFLEFFIGRCFPEPHSTKPIEDAIGWALETTPEVLADHDAGIDLPIRRRLQGALRARSLSGARPARRRGRAPLARARRGARRGDGRASSSRSRAPDTFRRRGIPVVFNLLAHEFVERLP